MTAVPGVLHPELERTSNRVELVGYLGRPPELRYTVERERVVTLWLATHRWATDIDEPRQLTDWHRVVVVGSAVSQCQALQAGELLRVIGWLHTSNLTDARGHRWVSTEVVLERLRREPSLVRQRWLLPFSSSAAEPT